MNLIQMLSRLFRRHDQRHRAIELAIDHLQEQDHELERRLKILRDRVDVYHRSTEREDPSQ